MLNFWNGHKTKILMTAGSLLTVVYGMKFISQEVFTFLGLMIAWAGGTTIHQAIMRESAAVTAEVETVKSQIATVDRKVATVAPAVAHAVAAEVKAVVQDAAPAFPSRSGDMPRITRP